MLPDGDGVEVCRSIREWSEMPILVLSAVGDEREKVRALEAGADDYVTKPFGPDELVARLRAALRRVSTAEPEEPVLTSGSSRSTLPRRRVTRAGEEVHLTPTEFELLRLLVRNRGRLLTHRALLKEVWGPGFQDDTQVLRVHIANLRRKIEPEPGKPEPDPHRPGRRLPLRGVDAGRTCPMRGDSQTPARSALLRLHARLAGWRLDRRLAGGADPWDDELLGCRAEQLQASERRTLPQPSAMYADELLALAERLDAERPVDPRGVARARMLLLDGTSPLYRPASPLKLQSAVDRALNALGS